LAADLTSPAAALKPSINKKAISHPRKMTIRNKNVYVLNKFSFGPSQENEGRKKTLPGIYGICLTGITQYRRKSPDFRQKHTKTTKTNRIFPKIS